MLFDGMLSVATGVGSFRCTIYARAVHMDVAFWKFSNTPTNSVSVAGSMKFLIILHSTCTGPFSGGIDVIGFLLLDFGTRENIHLL